jgi:serine/threonine protein kinase
VPLYEVGNFLGGGAAGTVYEAEHVRTKQHYALKILNPLGYKMLSPSLLRRCSVVSKGKPVTEAAERGKEPITKEHVWWLLNGSTKQYLVAFYSERQRSLHELSLVQCMNIWGVELPAAVTPSPSAPASPLASPSRGGGGGGSSPARSGIPALPPKYEDFVRRRARIFREICNMRKISAHENVIRLESVLELAQDSKCTIFLVMELANGGELFDRIKIDCGTVEETAGKFFSQLLHGVRHCHEEGVCHRDLKPENLLLQDTADGPLLKVSEWWVRRCMHACGPFYLYLYLELAGMI